MSAKTSGRSVEKSTHLPTQVALAEGMINKHTGRIDAKNNGAPSQHDCNTQALNVLVGGKLNPEWVAWIMNWPPGWTSLEQLSREAFDSWLHSANWWEQEPAIPRTVESMPDRVAQIRALGNGQVPLCAAIAWRVLMERITGGER